MRLEKTLLLLEKKNYIRKKIRYKKNNSNECSPWTQRIS